MENLVKGKEYDGFNYNKYCCNCHKYYCDNLQHTEKVSNQKATALLPQGLWLLFDS